MDTYTESLLTGGRSAEVYLHAKQSLHNYHARATVTYMMLGRMAVDIRIDYDTIICDDIEVYEQELSPEIEMMFRRDAYDAMWADRFDEEATRQRYVAWDEAYQDHLFAKENNEYALYEYHKAEIQAADQ